MAASSNPHHVDVIIGQCGTKYTPAQGGNIALNKIFVQRYAYWSTINDPSKPRANKKKK